jgi:TolA-binding protein
MTAEEMERAISFLLDSQARHDAQIGQLNEQMAELVARVAETSRIVQMQAESQSQLNELLTKTMTDLATAQQRAEARSLARHDETDARLARLSVVVERLVEERGSV